MTETKTQKFETIELIQAILSSISMTGVYRV